MSVTRDPEVIVDAEVVDDPAPLTAPPSTAIARRERRSEVMRPLDVDQLVDSFQQYQEMLPRLLAESDYQDAGTDSRTGKPKKFVKKSGWRKIATAFDLDVIIVSDEVERDEHGHPRRAKVVARAIAPSGRMMDGDGYCDVDEDRFEKSSSRKKLENDLRATATTRAKNRAISDLVGMGEVSAEEVSGDGGGRGAPFGSEVDDAMRKNASAALTRLFGGNAEQAREAWGKVRQHCGGIMPQAAALAILSVDAKLRELSDRSNGSGGDASASAHDAPAAAQNGDGPEPSPELIAGLEDEALQLWRQLVTDHTAIKKVSDANGDPKILAALVEAAKKAVAKKAVKA